MNNLDHHMVEGSVNRKKCGSCSVLGRLAPRPWPGVSVGRISTRRELLQGRYLCPNLEDLQWGELHVGSRDASDSTESKYASQSMQA